MIESVSTRIAHPTPKLDQNIMLFVRLLRAIGLKLGSASMLEAIDAAKTVGVTDKDFLYHALVSCLIKRREDKPLFDQAFYLFWQNPKFHERIRDLILPSIKAAGHQQEDVEKMLRRLSDALADPPDDPPTTVEDLEIDAFLHCNDLTYAKNPEEELKKYKKGDKLKVKVLEIKKDQQKIRVGYKQTKADPFDWFKDKKINDAITVKVIYSDNRGLVVKPEGSEIECTIKKSQIAINPTDARPSRFVGSERIDAAIAELDKEKRKVSLSIKLLEEIQNKDAISKFSSPLSGKNLPFSSLSDKLDKKTKK